MAIPEPAAGVIDRALRKHQRQGAQVLSEIERVIVVLAGRCDPTAERPILDQQRDEQALRRAASLLDRPVDCLLADDPEAFSSAWEALIGWLQEAYAAE